VRSSRHLLGTGRRRDGQHVAERALIARQVVDLLQRVRLAVDRRRLLAERADGEGQIIEARFLDGLAGGGTATDRGDIDAVGDIGWWSASRQT
jgi:hypothetical protein